MNFLLSLLFAFLAVPASLFSQTGEGAKSQDLGKYSKIEKLKEFLFFNSLLAGSQEEPVCSFRF